MSAVKRSASGSVLAAVVFLVVSLVPANAQHLPLPLAEQQKVNDAIDFGVRFLKKTQLPDGSWPPMDKPQRVGYVALPALTLLECGEPLDDPVVKKAIRAVRRGARETDRTYELALSILLLDRVGDPKDRDLIQTMALRLVAGQTMTGGWGYRCPTIGPRHQKEFLEILRKLNPPPGPGFLAGEKPPAGGPGPIAGGPGKEPAPGQGPAGGTATNPPGGPDKSISPSGSSGSPSGDTALRTVPGPSGTTPGAVSGVAPLPASKDPPKDAPRDETKKPPAGKEEPRKEEPGKQARVVIPDALQQLPVLQDPNGHVLAEPAKHGENSLGTTDNSNTQFAILALWVAQRYDVPMERTMNLMVRRFQTSQNADGSWGYRYRFLGGEQEKNTMDCVGLIGLAVGLGISQPAAGNGGAVVGKNIPDPRILNGFVALSRHVGQPTGRMFNLQQANLYYLWSLERVAVIYGLPTIANKDWYRWGAEILVANQQPQGFWMEGQYPGATPVMDTCMALLFLKKANLVKDLPDRLPVDPDALVKALNDRLAGTPAKPAQTPPPPAEPPTPVAPPESTPAKEPVVQTPPRVAPVSSPPVESGSNRKLWGFLLLGVFVVLALVSMLLLWQYNAQRKRTPGGEKVGSRKGAKPVRRDGPTASGSAGPKQGRKNADPSSRTAKG